MSDATCPICQKGTQSHFITHNGLDVFECSHCDTKYMYPLPSYDFVEEFYDDSYEGATTGYFSKVDKKLRRTRKRVKMLKGLHKRAERFLDVGCNGGFCVENVAQLGMQAVGVDLDGASIAYAKENYPAGEYYHNVIENMPGLIDPFDIVYSSEVIEHVPDPHAFVEAISKLMKPGAIFYVTTPDIHHWRVPNTITDWDAFGPPSHCLYFSRQSLQMLLEAHGLKVIKTLVAFKPGIKMIARKVS